MGKRGENSGGVWRATDAGPGNPPGAQPGETWVRVTAGRGAADPGDVFIRVATEGGLRADGLVILGRPGAASMKSSALRDWRLGEAITAALDHVRAANPPSFADWVAVETAKALKERPKAGRVVVNDDFLTRVGLVYEFARLVEPDRPVVWVAEWAGRPVATVSRWISRARAIGAVRDEGGSNGAS